ncbi:MAG TPA: DUF3048 domain-containing protein [Coriobacteriia bacterium]
MRHRIVLTVLALALVASVSALAGCKGSTTIESLWPAASTERVVPKPAGTPRWPLTGLEAPSFDATTIRVVSVKIENHSGARPQSGLDKADVVYEVISEGGITRFHALFQSQVPKVVGPVRSCRPPDLFLIQQYHSLLAHVGGPKSVRTILASDKTRYNDMDQFFNPAAYWRVSTRSAPHNMYMDITKLRGFATTKRGYPASETVTGFEFARASSAATPTVTQLTVPVSASTKSSWRYDPATRTYARSINGTAHKDAVTGKQLTSRNVIVMWANITPYPGDTHGVVQIALTGSGRVSVFIGGQRVDGTWEAGTDAPPRFKDASGAPIKLDPGNTWIQVIGTTQNISTK